MVEKFWKRLAPGSLMIQFYLWFLLALTLTVAGTAGVVGLFLSGDINIRIQERVLSEVRLGRDMAERMLRTVSDPEDLRSLLEPLAADGRLAVEILNSEGKRLLHLKQPGIQAGEGETTLWENSRKALEQGHWYDFDREGRISAALPMTLPGGEKGVFHVSVRTHHEHERSHTQPLLIGLGAVLVLGWLLCWPLAARLTRPLRRMAGAADALGAGNLDVRIGLKRRDEIGRLAHSFDTMAESVQRLLASHKQLLADVSHEFRAPLSRLRVALELARSEEKDKAATYLNVVEKQTDAIDGMIEELLTYSRLDAAPYQLHPQPIASAEIVGLVMDDLMPDAEAAGIVLETDDDADAGAAGEISGDPTLLARALGNVLRNAIVYSPQGSTVRLALELSAGRLTFAVSDEGPGVAPEMLERIFEPFVRTSAARSRASGGVGLGLAIARRCMQAHGGGATAEAGTAAEAGATAKEGAAAHTEAKGNGLVVKLWLPLQEN